MPYHKAKLFERINLSLFNRLKLINIFVYTNYYIVMVLTKYIFIFSALCLYLYFVTVLMNFCQDVYLNISNKK